MEFPNTLDALPVGRGARVCRLDAAGMQRRRLLDLGFVPGAAVTALQAWGDPVAYGIRGAVIALRQEDAAAIKITEREA